MSPFKLNPWPTGIFGFPVTRHEIGHGAALVDPVSIVLHTEEALSDEAAERVFRAHPTWASTVAIDGDSIIQFRGFHEWAGALEDLTPQDSPNAHAVQIEIAAYSKTFPYTLGGSILERVAAVVAYAAKGWGVPLLVPNPQWHDDCKDMPLPWAVETNARRRWAAQGGAWPKVRGVWEHLEVPRNKHWDCGALNRSVIIAKAKALLGQGPHPAPGWPGRYFRLTTPLMHGTGVVVWQTRLHRAYGFRLIPDGAFGPDTDKATRAFQKRAHLPADGVVGPATWAAAWK